MKKLFATLLFLFSIASFSQETSVSLAYYLPDTVSYDETIPTPESVIGHQVGEWHVSHDKLVMYMKELADVSDRITIENRGTTFEGRPLLLLTVTSPENHRNLSSIQQQHQQIVESGDADVTNMPIVVYQGFSIHGNEASGSNAALLLAYHLAAAQGSEIENLLQNTVILLDPSFNPDGLQRFSQWVNTHKSQHLNPDPNDREYDEIWPGGRTNHYWFDMNRDWLPVQLPESRARIETFHKWYPNILTDHHEMGTNASFFFQPGIPSRTHPLTPQQNQDLTADIGNFHAKAFDEIGSLYYTKESFDDFYYGKGSTFPDINGGIGILFEQASSRGHVQESENGLLTFPFTIRNQLTAAFSTLEAAQNMRQDLLSYQQKFFNEARSEANGKSAIVFGDEKDPSKTFHLAEILNRHKIKLFSLEKDITLNGKTFTKGNAYVVPKDQRQYRLVEAMFEKRTEFQDSLFYDVSAWTLPLAFNLPYAENVAGSSKGAEVTDLKNQIPTPPSRSNYAYLMPWSDYYAPKALHALLEKGIRAKVALKQFRLENKEYDYGTILIPVVGQSMSPQELHRFVSDLCKSSHQPIVGVSTGLSEGINLGSRNFAALSAPKVAVLVGDGVSSYDAGEIWHLFDTRYNIPITKLDTRNLDRTDLSRYTDIIVPNSYGSTFDTMMGEKLSRWVEDGGTLIGYKNSGRWMDKLKLLSLDFKTRKDTAQNISFEQRQDYYGAKGIGGAIFETKLDRTHPIAFGYTSETLPVFRNSTLFLKPETNSFDNPILYTDSPLMSGYIDDANLEALKNTAAVRIGRKGRGRVIYFTDNTNFRAFWYGTNKLLMNAIFFGGEM
ncbi:M14 family metallopeptidase [Flavobacteriaceae bacterium TK19130]|nr:M14 family metallopeptidase [Thermobacterium salinum]